MIGNFKLLCLAMNNKWSSGNAGLVLYDNENGVWEVIGKLNMDSCIGRCCISLFASLDVGSECEWICSVAGWRLK